MLKFIDNAFRKKYHDLYFKTSYVEVYLCFHSNFVIYCFNFKTSYVEVYPFYYVHSRNSDIYFKTSYVEVYL